MGRWTHDVGVPKLLNHFTRNGLSATWAMVGAMTRPSLPDVSGLPEVNYRHFLKPWFSDVPKEGGESTHPEWFGASLVEMIGTQTRSRNRISFVFTRPLGRPGMTRERAIAEYRYCAQIAQELGIRAPCFVFPRNLVAYLADLRDAGFTCFRDVDELPVRFASHTLAAVEKMLADFAGLSPCMIEPSLKEGMVSIPDRC